MPSWRHIKMMSVALLLVAAFFTCSGFTTTGDASVKHSGKAEAVFTVKSDAARDDFVRRVEEKVNGINIVSGASDMVTVRGITETDGGYEVKVQLRRLDKVKAHGEYDLAKFNDCVAEGSMSSRLLESMYKANLSCTMPMYYNNYLGQITLLKERTVEIKPHDAAGRELSLEEFVAAGRVDTKSSMFMFRAVDVANIETIRITLPGKIKYYGNERIEVVDESTFRIAPFDVKAQLLKNSVVVEDGVEKIEPTVTTETVGAIMGYVVYEKSASPFAIGMYTTAGCLAAGLLAALVIVVYMRGRAEIRKAEIEQKR